MEFNDLQKNNNNSLYCPLKYIRVPKYKSTANFYDGKDINNSFSKKSIIKKNINHQILYNILSNMFIFFLNEKSKLIDITKSFSKIIKTFSPEIKKIYFKMLNYLNNCRAGKLNQIINKKTFVNEMINAYNTILTKREQNILILNKNKIILQKNIYKNELNSDKLFSSETISPTCFNNSYKVITFHKNMSKIVNNTISL